MYKNIKEAHIKMNILTIAGGIGVIALLFAAYASGKITAFKVENDRVNELSGIIQRGAMAFLYRAYRAPSASSAARYAAPSRATSA